MFDISHSIKAKAQLPSLDNTYKELTRSSINKIFT